MILENERFDLIQKNGYGIIQNKKWFAYGIDAVLLSYFAKVKKNDVVVDLGTGTAIIPLLLHLNTEAKNFFAVEKQKAVCEMAQRSLDYNDIKNIELINCDVKDLKNHIRNSSVNVVVSNPPYFRKGNALVNLENIKAIAKHETSADLEDFIKTASDLLVEKGCFYMVHRPMRLVDIMFFCRKYNLEPKTVRFVYPNKNKEPNIVLIKCVKNGQIELKYEPNLYVYDDNQNYCSEIFEIYEAMKIDVFKTAEEKQGLR